MKPSVERFTGFADLYDQVRPSPPEAIADLLLQLAKLEMAERVVDLGCGSGLSMVMWVARTWSIIGVEPSQDMRREAESRCSRLFSPDALTWTNTEADATQITSNSIDIVTASQSFHWMNPQTTLAEVARILRPGGVFAAIDCDWPPSVLPELELAYNECIAKADDPKYADVRLARVKAWPKDQHLDNIRQSGLFRLARESAFHKIESGNSERLAGLVRSQGSVAALLKAGVSEAEIGLIELRETGRRLLGDRQVPWFWSYRVRIGVKRVVGRHKTYMTHRTYSGGRRAQGRAVCPRPPVSSALVLTAYRSPLTTHRLNAAGTDGAPPDAY
jgi:ubiquinone/menaquinone biosynthesis C-methylase UbiE